MSASLAVLVAMLVFIVVLDPIRLANVRPPQRLPGAVEYFSHVLPSFSIYGLAVLLATAGGVTVRQRRGARKAASVDSVQ